MHINIYSKDSANVVVLSGKLNNVTSDKVQEKIEKLVVPGCCLIFDMDECQYVSNSGLRVLLIIAKQLAKVGGKGALVGLAEEVKDIMSLTGYDNLFNNYNTVSEAIQLLKKGDKKID